MIIQQRSRERHAPAHVLECVEAHQPEALEREAGHRGLPLLAFGQRIDPPVDRLDPAESASDGGKDVPLGSLAPQNHVLAARLAQFRQGDDQADQAEKGNAADDGESKDDLVVREVRHGTASYTSAMRPHEVEALLKRVEQGEVDVERALRELQRSPVDDLGYARLDTHRELRQGMPEAIYAEGKTTEQVLGIAARLLETTSSAVIATRCQPETMAALSEGYPEAMVHERARLVVLRSEGDRRLGRLAVLCAGTSDLPVADEAAGTAAAVGFDVDRVTDVGVAGVHRVLAMQSSIAEADVVVVVAGMEGALPSVVGGLTGAPVIAVPTSVGYGAAFDGLAALLGMLNSCAAGLVVTNIDNGFGAALAALRIMQRR